MSLVEEVVGLTEELELSPREHVLGEQQILHRREVCHGYLRSVHPAVGVGVDNEERQLDRYIITALIVVDLAQKRMVAGGLAHSRSVEPLGDTTGCRCFPSPG